MNRWPLVYSNIKIIAADPAFLALVGTDAFVLFHKAAALHNLHGSLVIRKADTGDFEEPQLGHDDR